MIAARSFQGFFCAVSVLQPVEIFSMQENTFSQLQVIIELLTFEMLHMHIFKHSRFLQLVADIAWWKELYNFLRFRRSYVKFTLLICTLKQSTLLCLFDDSVSLILILLAKASMQLIC